MKIRKKSKKWNNKTSKINKNSKNLTKNSSNSNYEGRICNNKGIDEQSVDLDGRDSIKNRQIRRK